VKELRIPEIKGIFLDIITIVIRLEKLAAVFNTYVGDLQSVASAVQLDINAVDVVYNYWLLKRKVASTLLYCLYFCTSVHSQSIYKLHYSQCLWLLTFCCWHVYSSVTVVNKNYTVSQKTCDFIFDDKWN